MELNVKKALIAALTVFSVLAISPQTRGEINTVELDIIDYGIIRLELFPDITPVTVANFLDYVNADFYDGLIFHRVVKDFVDQTGHKDPNDVVSPTNPPIENEFLLSNLRGTIAMAKIGGNPNSATSQFFINVKDNSANLDNQNGGFTVFGRVVSGMDVADAINVVTTDGSDEPIEPVVIASAVQKAFFDPNSNDFSDTDYLGVVDSDSPYIFIGQGEFLYQKFTITLSNETIAGISTIKITQSGADAVGVDQYELWLAKDIFNDIWIVKYILNGSTEVEAANAESVVSFSTLADEDMQFRVINGNTVPFSLSDSNYVPNPANIILTTVDGITTKQEIVSFEASDAFFPDYLKTSFPLDNLVVVEISEVNDPDGEKLWQYYHPVIGLTFEVTGTGSEITNVDHNGTGWHFITYDEAPTDPIVSFKASDNRTSPSDSFTISGNTNIKLTDLMPAENTYNQFTIMLSNYQSPWISFSEFKPKKDGTRFVYSGSPDGEKNKFKIVLDPVQPTEEDPNIFTSGTFSLSGKKLNLNGVDTPITATLFSGTFGESTDTLFKKNKSLPIEFRLGYTDRLKVISFTHTTNPASILGYSNIKIKGHISVNQDAATIDLTNIDVTVKWDQQTVIYNNFKQKNNRNKYIHKGADSTARKAVFDFDKGSFIIYIRNSSLSNPSTTRSFTVSFQSGTKSFDETVAEVGIGTLPAESNE